MSYFLVFVQRDCRLVRRYASRNARLLCKWYTEFFLVFVNQTTSLLLCWLVVSNQKVSSYRIRLIPKIFQNLCNFLVLQAKNLLGEYLVFAQKTLPKNKARRIAVGLKPLGHTSNDW